MYIKSKDLFYKLSSPQGIQMTQKYVKCVKMRTLFSDPGFPLGVKIHFCADFLLFLDQISRGGGSL